MRFELCRQCVQACVAQTADQQLAQCMSERKSRSVSPPPLHARMGKRSAFATLLKRHASTMGEKSMYATPT